MPGEVGIIIKKQNLETEGFTHAQVLDAEAASEQQTQLQPENVPEGHPTIAGSPEERLAQFDKAVASGACMKNMGETAVKHMRQGLERAVQGDTTALKTSMKNNMERQKADKAARKVAKEAEKITAKRETERELVKAETSAIVQEVLHERDRENIVASVPTEELPNQSMSVELKERTLATHVAEKQSQTAVVEHAESLPTAPEPLMAEVYRQEIQKVQEVTEQLQNDAEPVQLDQVVNPEKDEAVAEAEPAITEAAAPTEAFVQLFEPEFAGHREEATSEPDMLESIKMEPVESADFGMELQSEAGLLDVELDEEQASELLGEADAPIEIDGELHMEFEAEDDLEVPVADRISELLAEFAIIPETKSEPEPAIVIAEAVRLEVDEGTQLEAEPVPTFTEQLDSLIEEVVPEVEQPIAHELLERIQVIIRQEVLALDQREQIVASSEEVLEFAMSEELEAAIEELCELLKLDDPELANRIVLQIRKEIMDDLAAEVEPPIYDPMHEIMTDNGTTHLSFNDLLHSLLGKIAISELTPA